MVSECRDGVLYLQWVKANNSCIYIRTLVISVGDEAMYQVGHAVAASRIIISIQARKISETS